MSSIIKVAVRAESFVYDKPYSYFVPEGMNIVPGMRVLVPFGAGNRPVQSIVLTAPQKSQEELVLKTVLRPLDESPVLSENDISLMLWLRDRCFCTCYDVLRTMIPIGLDFKTDNSYRPVPVPPDKTAPGSRSKLYPVYELIRQFPDGITDEKLKQHFPGTDLNAILSSLLKKKLIEADRKDIQVCKEKKQSYVSLCRLPEHTKAGSATGKIVSFMQGGTEFSLKEVCYYTGVKPAAVKRLIENGTLTERTVDAPPQLLPELSADTDRVVMPDPDLNPEQQMAFNGLKNLLDNNTPHVALLYGITGSGKTFVYIRLIRHCLATGKKAIVLVPEIALTPQLLARFQKYFSGRLALIHSSLSVRDRYEQWKRIRNGDADVVIGTRSAIFAPLENIGLIILDEEQEYTYRSENAPCYHARDVAKYRAAKSNALVVLGSATPSVETMYYAKIGVYSLFRLTERYGAAGLPNVIIADMTAELRSGNGGLVGKDLKGSLSDAFKSGHQAILFLNRRGSARSVFCNACGKSIKCPNCSVSLTYHSANGRMMCHYCGYSRPLSLRCPICGSANLSRDGGGTQKAEEELKYLFPDQTIIRMDADTTSCANSHSQLLKRFQSENISMLVGTQMIAKGLDFPNVTIVGVLDADQMLAMPDFRASERAFSMITQAVGRSGRGSERGLAVIQTSDPDNTTVCAAASQDYDSFYNHEVIFRQAFEYPPFCDILCLELTFSEQTALYSAAVALSEQLKSAINGTVFPPVPAPIFKINNKLHYRVLAKTKNTPEMRRAVSAILKQFLSEKSFSGIGLHAVLNPYD